MNFNGATKVKEIAVADPRAKQILEESGVDYCCGGDKSLHEACMHADVSAEEILSRLRKNTALAGPDDGSWISAPLADLTLHIRERHHRYVREAIPRVEALLTKVKAKHGKNHPEIADIEKLFVDLGKEMIMHMQKEEQILFPYIDALERSASGNGTLEPPFFQTVRNPIHSMMKDHDSAGELARKIRKASLEYTPPADGCASYQALYLDLHEFEADLHQHIHLENNILFPRAVEMESAVV
ncbi:MAG: iron-sulfur cluster repair di-iron protein [Acidobacteriia bacterium]|nr:iron-sulfur cluster repair di-iron protein [Terriglobia bacterium]